MIIYQHFELVDKYFKNFRFKRMNLEDQKRDIYSCSQTQKRYFIKILSKEQCDIISLCTKNGIFCSIVGLLKKKEKDEYFCFSKARVETLADFVQKNKSDKEYINQLFCYQLIQSLMTHLTFLLELGKTIKILTPYSILINPSPVNTNCIFSLSFPFCHDIFRDQLRLGQIQQNIEFCSPQIISAANSDYQGGKGKFKKSWLYSLGLILLFCFGYLIKIEERKKALRNNKQFKIFLKQLRKQIKTELGGKFISKIISITMQANETMRDTTKTFQLKFRSPHLASLRSYYYEPQQQKQLPSYVPTIFSDPQDVLHSVLKDTISIHGSSESVNKSCRSKNQLRSNKQMKDFVKQNSQKEIKGNDNTSPIQIHIDWDQLEGSKNSIQTSQLQITPFKSTGKQIDSTLGKNMTQKSTQEIKITINSSFSNVKSKSNQNKIQKTNDTSFLNIGNVRTFDKKLFETFQKSNPMIKEQKYQKQYQKQSQRQEIQHQQSLSSIKRQQSIYEQKQQSSPHQVSSISNVIKYEGEIQQFSIYKPKITKQTNQPEKYSIFEDETNQTENKPSIGLIKRTEREEMEKQLQNKGEAVLLIIIILVIIYTSVDFLFYSQ